jgi:hypothetical protein
MPDKKTEFKQGVATGAKGREDGDRYVEDVLLTSTEADQIARNAGVQPAPEVK